MIVLEDAEAVAGEAAARVADLARQAVAARGRFAVALAGGATPRPAFRRLAREPLRSAVPWGRTEVFWSDERCVAPEHPESNYRLARETLLDAVPIPAERVHRITGEAPDPAAAAAAYETEIARVLGGRPGGPPPDFDLVMLGIGADGHTASLFPGTAALAERIRWVVATRVPTLSVADRITLTYPILNRAACVLFLVVGADKAPALRAILEEPPDPERLPAQGVRPDAGGPVWLVDRAAAARLTTRLTAPVSARPWP
ncbi:MAG TPA: 6-phosphogluconolactonase [Methylomirabilota bacterium]|nr:6-phosphogluconolactonase [Methylomirabilota bacterium]